MRVERLGRMAAMRSRAPLIAALAEVLGDVELDLLAAVAGEAVDAVGVAERVERLGHQEERLLLDVDHATAPRRLARSRRTPQRVVVVDADVVVVPRRRPFRARGVVLHLRVGRGAHVEQERGGDLALAAVAAHVDLLGGRGAGAAIGARLDRGVEIDVLAVGEPLEHASRVGPQQLELTLDLGEELGLLAARRVELGGGLLHQAGLGESAPGAAVARVLVVPLVVVVDAAARRQVAQLVLELAREGADRAGETLAHAVARAVGETG